MYLSSSRQCNDYARGPFGVIYSVISNRQGLRNRSIVSQFTFSKTTNQSVAFRQMTHVENYLICLYFFNLWRNHKRIRIKVRKWDQHQSDKSKATLATNSKKSLSKIHLVTRETKNFSDYEVIAKLYTVTGEMILFSNVR